VENIGDGELTERGCQDGCLNMIDDDWMLGMPERAVLRPILLSCCRPSMNALLYTLYVVVALVPTLPAYKRRTFISSAHGQSRGPHSGKLCMNTKGYSENGVTHRVAKLRLCWPHKSSFPHMIEVQ
jgi:hypothetical protein